MKSAWYSPWTLAILAAAICLTQNAYAGFVPLQCSGGVAVSGTSLYDATSNGACQYTGIEYIFSTIMCQFVTMINVIMGKLFCSIQGAVISVIIPALTVFVVVYGIQMVIGTVQMNGAELVMRAIKIGIVLWIATDPIGGVSSAISFMFNFFFAFISDTTRWVMTVMSMSTGLNFNQFNPYNPGINETFKFLDDWILDALTGSLSAANSKVIGFFVAMSVAMPSLFMIAIYWWVSVAKMLMATLLSFLMAITAISFLLALSPIFVGFILFKSTFQYFDQWLRFMCSYAIQVMLTFAILTLWMACLQLFAPFFNELSEVIYPYEKVIRPAAAIYSPADTWGLCPMAVYTDPQPHVVCVKSGFNPVAPGSPNTSGNTDYENLIPPTKVPEMNGFIFYLFYHLISLIIVTYGFSSLQKNASSIAKQLAGPSYVPVLNAIGVGNTGFGQAQGAQGQANKFMSKDVFAGMHSRHEIGESPYEKMIHGAQDMVIAR